MPIGKNKKSATITLVFFAKVSLKILTANSTYAN